MAVSVAPWLQIRMVVVVILYLYRNMIVCNSSVELFQSKKHLMLQWKLHWKEGDDACMLCMVWQWLVHILLRKCWIQFYYTIVSNLALFASAFRCLLRTSISRFKCFRFRINCNCSYKNWHKKLSHIMCGDVLRVVGRFWTSLRYHMWGEKSSAHQRNHRKSQQV